MLSNIIDRIKLPFRKEKELYVALYNIIGFYPHDISLYKLALMHKSMYKRNAKGKPVNNERLEFLGDAVLDAAVGDIVYRHFPGKREGFLTNTRSKLVQRETLGRLAQEMGITQLILSSGRSMSHNSYMGGNAFEALVGALYLDRGYDACMQFLQKRILNQMINIDKVAYKEVNFKSKLIEWAQKNRVRLDFRLVEQHKDNNGSPVFTYMVEMEGVDGCDATGYSKKESQQMASKRTLEKLRKQPQYLDSVFAAKTNRTKMEEEPVETVPSTEPEDFIIVENGGVDAARAAAANDNTVADRATPAATEERPARRPRRAPMYDSADDAPEGLIPQAAVTAADEPQPVRPRRDRQRERRTSGHALVPMTPIFTGDDDSQATDSSIDECDSAAYDRRYSDSNADNADADNTLDLDSDEFDLSSITTRDKSREEIIAAAEAAAFGEEEA
ncbi:MAG: ribonuclease III [Prevotella sp.]|nr:ribonuclease III [Prevotella sp.]